MKIDSSIINCALRAAEHPQLLETAEQLRQASAEWRTDQPLGIDTEFLRERTYRAELGLVQVSDGKIAWLVDTIAIHDLAPLQAMLSDPRVLKILHSTSEDLEVLQHTLGVTPLPMVDTQIACALLGQPLQMSYTHAVRWMTGIEVDKEQTRSNWTRRPLKPEQLHYAATDVVFLPAMYVQLRKALDKLGRWTWLEEDVERMAANSRQEIDTAQAYLRLNGGKHLDLQSLHVLKGLAAWREETAMQKNLARGFVLPDAALLELAGKKPRSRGALLEINGIHPKAAQRYQREILNVIKTSSGRSDPIEQLQPLDGGQRDLLNKMRKLVQNEAETLNLDPAVLASRKQLESLILALCSGAPLPQRMTGWRKPVISQKLQELAAASDCG